MTEKIVDWDVKNQTKQTQNTLWPASSVFRVHIQKGVICSITSRVFVGSNVIHERKSTQPDRKSNCKFEEQYAEQTEQI